MQCLAIRLPSDRKFSGLNQMSGIDAVHKLVHSGSTAKFVLLTIHAGEEYINACLAEGARGFVAKSRMKAHLIPAIHAVLDGLPYISSPGGA